MTFWKKRIGSFHPHTDLIRSIDESDSYHHKDTGVDSSNDIVISEKADLGFTWMT